MWINRKDWEDVRKRLCELEVKHQSLVSDVKDGRTIDILTGKKRWVSGFTSYMQVDETRPLSLKDALSRVLSHLGLRFSYVEGEPERIELQKDKR